MNTAQLDELADFWKNMVLGLKDEVVIRGNRIEELEKRIRDMQLLIDMYAQRVTVQDTEIAILRQREEVR